jgi:hypothetical protein
MPVPKNSFLVITEGADTLELAPRPRITLGSGTVPTAHDGH